MNIVRNRHAIFKTATRHIFNDATSEEYFGYDGIIKFFFHVPAVPYMRVFIMERINTYNNPSE